MSKNKPFRVLTYLENQKLTSDAQGLLLQLYEYNYLDLQEVEKILNIVMKQTVDEVDSKLLTKIINTVTGRPMPKKKKIQYLNDTPMRIIHESDKTVQ